MSEWKKVKLGDVCEITSSKRIFLSEYVDKGIPFYRSKEIAEKAKHEEVSNPLYISEERYEEIKSKYGIPVCGDILLTAIGATLGIPYVVGNEPPFYFKDGNLIWLRNFNKELCSGYLHSWMASKFGYQSLQNVAIGSAQKALTIAAIKSLEIALPPVETQRRIATILSRYDSLIENYQKQIKLLEEAAQRLYKEWFIDLHFPGHENTNIIDGVPEGWEKMKVGDLIAKVPRSKQIPTKDYQKKGAIPIIDQSRDYIAGYTDDMESKVESNEPYIVFGDHTRILKYIPFPFAKGADGTQLIMSNNLDLMPQCLLFTSLVNVDLSNYSYARHFKYLKEEIIPVPTASIANVFSKHVGKWYAKIQQNRYQLRLLTEARDRLLPKLMSGDIEI